MVGPTSSACLLSLALLVAPRVGDQERQLDATAGEETAAEDAPTNDSPNELAPPSQTPVEDPAPHDAPAEDRTQQGPTIEDPRPEDPRPEDPGTDHPPPEDPGTGDPGTEEPGTDAPRPGDPQPSAPPLLLPEETSPEPAPPAESPAVQATDEEDAPNVEAAKTRVERERKKAKRQARVRRILEFGEPLRHGIVLSGGVGASFCVTGWCEAYGFKAGGLGRIEAGYRHGIVAGVLSVSGGGAPVEKLHVTGSERPLRVDGSLTFLDIGVGALLFPIRNKRFDLFFGARLGWTHARAKLDLRRARIVEYSSRGGLRFALGLPVYVTRLVSLGPRFDVTVPFAGKLCLKVSGSQFEPRDDCTKIADLEEEAFVDSSEQPIPFAITLDVRAVLPTPN